MNALFLLFGNRVRNAFVGWRLLLLCGICKFFVLFWGKTLLDRSDGIQNTEVREFLWKVIPDNFLALYQLEDSLPDNVNFLSLLICNVMQLLSKALLKIKLFMLWLDQGVKNSLTLFIYEDHSANC